MSTQVAYVGPADDLDTAIDRFKQHRGFIACDTETVSTTDLTCLGVGFAISGSEAIYFRADLEEGPHARGPYFSVAMEILADKRDKIFFGGAGFDLDVIDKAGWKLGPWHDVAIMSRIQAMPGGLEENALEQFGRQHPRFVSPDTQTGSPLELLIPKGKNVRTGVNPGKLAWKCLCDCQVTWLLYNQMCGPDWHDGISSGFTWQNAVMGLNYDVTARMKECYKLDRALIPVLRAMGKTGVKLNHRRLYEHYEKLAEEKFRYESICRQHYGFNPGSNQQTGMVLAERGNFLPWTKNGQWKQLAVDGETLLKCDDPLAHIVLEYRARADPLSDVIEPYLGKTKANQRDSYKTWVPLERATTHWRIDLATSRLASGRQDGKGRNLQNITPWLRDIFEPDECEDGTKEFTWWDLSQIEMRLFAHFSEDPTMLSVYEAYDKGEGPGIHQVTMEALFPDVPRYTCCKKMSCVCGLKHETPLYTDAKTFNFAMIYLALAVTLAAQTRRPVDQCEELKQMWLQKYDVGYKWMLERYEYALGHDYVETLEGRRCRLPTDRGDDHRGKCGINYIVQGTAAWPVKRALLDGVRLGFDQRIQVHDEVLINGRVDIPSSYSEYLPGIRTPFEVYHGNIWR